MYKVNLTYFKESGKYYSNGSYETQKRYLFEIFEEVKTMLKHGKRPGLIDGHCEFHVLIEVPDHPHDHPHFFTICRIKED